MPPVAVWGPAKASPDTVRADNLQFWFDASDSSTVFSDSSCSTVANNGSAVQCWKDKSGKNNNVSSSAGEYPTYTYDGPNGMPALDFDGTGDRLEGIVNGLSGNQEHTLIAVYKLRTRSGSWNRARPIAIGNSNIDGQEISFTMDEEEIYYDHRSRFLVSAPGEHKLVNKVDILTGTYNGVSVSTTNSKLYLNSLNLNTTLTNGGALDLSNGLTIGQRYDAADPFGGQIYELIFYDKKLSDNEREAVEAYLRAKWQKGVDGISSIALNTHLDPMKVNTVKTDTNATNCDTSTHTVAANGDTVSCILDRSGNSNHAGQATITKRPTLNTTGINNYPTMNFDGSNDFLSGELNGFEGGNSEFLLQQIHDLNSSGVSFLSGTMSQQKSDGPYEILAPQ